MPTISLSAGSILTHKSDCLLLFAAVKKSQVALSAAAKEADRALGGQIAALTAAGDFNGKSGEVAWLSPVAAAVWSKSGKHAAVFPHKRVLLAGLGEDDEDARDGLTQAFAAAAARKPATAAAAVEHLSPALAAHAARAAHVAAYKYQHGGYLPKPKKGVLAQVTLAAPRGFGARQLAAASAVGEGINLTRHLAEQPGNICTPAFLGECAAQLAKKTALRATVLGEAQIRRLKMGALLAVAKGSVCPPRFIVFEHHGGKKGAAPVVLVGKGVTFDTGGISLKPSAAMEEMKFDMCGAATVFGVMLALARAKTPLNVTGIVPSCENMPGGAAMKPGDVVTASDGQTIEVQNTDAEGRLLLADALIYADKLKPAAVIDIATLTGACVIALGRHVSGLMGRDEALLQALTAAGDECGDLCWPLPMGKRYQRQLKSDYADVANIGGRPGGTITAACFLSRFTKCEHWAHLDIAGTAWTDSKRASGRPVALLAGYLQARAGGGK